MWCNCGARLNFTKIYQSLGFQQQLSNLINWYLIRCGIQFPCPTILRKAYSQETMNHPRLNKIKYSNRTLHLDISETIITSRLGLWGLQTHRDDKPKKSILNLNRAFSKILEKGETRKTGPKSRPNLWAWKTIQFISILLNLHKIILCT